MDKNINVLSLNINGLQNTIKRKKTLAYIKKMKADIAFLQEAHLTDKEHQKLKRDWVGKVFSSYFHLKARGVAILIRNTLPVKIQGVIIDQDGRYVILNCQIYSEF